MPRSGRPPVLGVDLLGLRRFSLEPAPVTLLRENSRGMSEQPQSPKPDFVQAAAALQLACCSAMVALGGLVVLAFIIAMINFGRFT